MLDKVNYTVSTRLTCDTRVTNVISDRVLNINGSDQRNTLLKSNFYYF